MTSSRYLADLEEAKRMRVIVRADRLMEFAYASKELYGWLEQNGGAPDEALERWEIANVELAAALRFADRNLIE